MRARLVRAVELLDENNIFGSRSELLMGESLLTGLSMLKGPHDKMNTVLKARKAVEGCIDIFNENTKQTPGGRIDDLVLIVPGSSQIIKKSISNCLASLERLLENSGAEN